jgi:hypothetical protein
MPPSSWPRARDYQEAIQTPEVCFADSRLRSAKIHTNSMGVPFTAAGKSAVVFQATSDSTDVALRCFTRAAPDQRLRYRAIHAHLAPTPLAPTRPPSYMVDFKYWDDEMLVGGSRYPMVEMGWVAGDPLDVWVKRRLGQHRDLADQAAAWLLVVNDMQAREMAHGDLANDNCLVSGSQLKLIDYDGCFIPVLADKHPGEAGNPHFQHPGRPGYYAGNMDAFPSLVIYLSLLALQSDPALWRFHTDKNLIFVASDYKSPHKTPVWKALAKSPDARIVSLAAALAGMCESSVETLPSLTDVTGSQEVLLTERRLPTDLDDEIESFTSDAVRPPWWTQDALRDRTATGPIPVPQPPASSSVPPSVPTPAVPPAPGAHSAPSWLEDYVPKGPQSPSQPAARPVPAPAKPQVPAGPQVHGPVSPPLRPPVTMPTAPPPARRKRWKGGTLALIILIVLIAIIIGLAAR